MWDPKIISNIDWGININVNISLLLLRMSASISIHHHRLAKYQYPTYAQSIEIIESFWYRPWSDSECQLKLGYGSGMRGVLLSAVSQGSYHVGCFGYLETSGRWYCSCFHFDMSLRNGTELVFILWNPILSNEARSKIRRTSKGMADDGFWKRWRRRISHDCQFLICHEKISEAWLWPGKAF